MYSLLRALVTFLAFALVVLSVAPAWAEIEIDSNVSPQVVSLGGQVRYVVTIRGRNERPDRSLLGEIRPPCAQGLRLSSPSPSVSQKVQMVNFNTTEGSIEYAWQLVAAQEGTARIDASRVVYAGRQYALPAAEVQVVRENADAQSPEGGASVPEGALPAQTDYPNLDRQLRGRLFATLTFSKSDPCLQETIVAECVLYIDPDLIDSIRNPAWQAPQWVDCFAEQVPMNEFRASDVALGNRPYKKVVIGRFLLTPTRAGEVQVPLNEAQCAVRVRSSRPSFEDQFFGDFGFGSSFFDSMNMVAVRLPIAVATLQVRELPAEGRPASFQNTVGQFEFKAETDRTQMTEDDLLTLRLEISGNGYLGSVAEPRLPSLTGWRRVGADTKTEATNNLKALGGRKTFEFLLRPQRPGNLTVPRIEYAFFDPAQNRYVTQSAGPFAVSVAKGQAKEPLIVASGFEEPVRQGEENAPAPQVFAERIAHIHTALPSVGAPIPLYRRTSFLALQTMPPLAVLLALGLRARGDWRRRHRDRLHVRSAGTRARRELKQVSGALRRGDVAGFYALVAEALRAYMAAKLHRSATGLTIEEIEDACSRRGADADCARSLRRMLEECDRARYLSLESGTARAREVLDEASRLLGALDPYFK